MPNPDILLKIAARKMLLTMVRHTGQAIEQKLGVDLTSAAPQNTTDPGNVKKNQGPKI